MEKNIILQKLLIESPSFSPKEKEALNRFFTDNPEKIDDGIRVLEAEQMDLQIAQKDYDQKVMDMAESLVKETEQESQNDSRKKMQEILNKEKEDKKAELDQLDQILSFNK